MSARHAASRRGLVSGHVPTAVQYLVDVNATPITAQWVNAGTGSVTKPERQPTAVSDLTNRIQVVASGKTQEYIIGAPPTLAGGEVVQSVVLWCYCDAPATAATFSGQMFSLGSALGGSFSIGPTTAIGWQSVGVVQAVTQAQLNDLRARFVSTAGSIAASRDYATYFEINTLK